MSSYKIEHPIVQHYAGSLAYGTNLPTSDVDIRGIFCATPIQTRTPFFPVNEIDIPGAEDGKLYELSKYMQLYLDGNPNILETLWVDESDIIETSSIYKYLRSFREKLLSSKVAFTFTGYAVSQLKRIKGHNKWINNPQPVQAPMHKDYLKLIQNFSKKKIMPRDFVLGHLDGFGIIHYGGEVFGAVRTSNVGAVTSEGDFNISAKQAKDNTSVESPTFLFKYLADNYKEDKTRHEQYWQWKNNRNEVRAGMEEESGYDRKHAMHLIRLLRMGEEILSGEGVKVKRPDAKELLDIKNGSWSYEQILDYANEKDLYIRGELYKNTSLRRKPDIKLGANILMECQNMCWK